MVIFMSIMLQMLMVYLVFMMKGFHFTQKLLVFFSIMFIIIMLMKSMEVMCIPMDLILVAMMTMSFLDVL